jgi:hypothetical protein
MSCHLHQGPAHCKLLEGLDPQIHATTVEGSGGLSAAVQSQKCSQPLSPATPLPILAALLWKHPSSITHQHPESPVGLTSRAQLLTRGKSLGSIPPHRTLPIVTGCSATSLLRVRPLALLTVGTDPYFCGLDSTAATLTSSSGLPPARYILPQDLCTHCTCRFFCWGLMPGMHLSLSHIPDPWFLLR